MGVSRKQVRRLIRQELARRDRAAVEMLRSPLILLREQLLAEGVKSISELPKTMTEAVEQGLAPLGSQIDSAPSRAAAPVVRVEVSPEMSDCVVDLALLVNREPVKQADHHHPSSSLPLQGLDVARAESAPRQTAADAVERHMRAYEQLVGFSRGRDVAEQEGDPVPHDEVLDSDLDVRDLEVGQGDFVAPDAQASHGSPPVEDGSGVGAAALSVDTVGGAPGAVEGSPASTAPGRFVIAPGWYLDRFDRPWRAFENGFLRLYGTSRKNRSPWKAQPFRRLVETA